MGIPLKPKKPRTPCVRVTKQNRADLMAMAWARAQKMPAFGYQEIAAAVHVTLSAATCFVREWEKMGAIQPVDAKRMRMFWTCVEDFVWVDPKRERTPEENMWTAMRRLGSFMPSDVAAHAATETVVVEAIAAAEYCRTLLAAGYLTVVRRAAPAMAREAAYRLIRNTGPRPPMKRRVSAVVDGNDNKVYLTGGME